MNNLINEKLELSDIYYKYANIMNKNKITPINQSENLDIETDENIISKNKNEKKARKRKLDITDSSDKEDVSSGNEGYLKFNAISKKKLIKKKFKKKQKNKLDKSFDSNMDIETDKNNEKNNESEISNEDSKLSTVLKKSYKNDNNKKNIKTS